MPCYFLTSCQSVRVVTDYDKVAPFKTYKTFGFHKEGVDRAEINDLDKRRILNAIESALLKKGFTKSDTPDLMVNFFTKEKTTKLTSIIIISILLVMDMVGVGVLILGHNIMFQIQLKVLCILT